MGIDGFEISEGEPGCEALRGAATRTWWRRTADGRRARATEVAAEIAEAATRTEAERALADAVERWGAAAVPPISLALAEGGEVRAVCVVSADAETLADRLRRAP